MILLDIQWQAELAFLSTFAPFAQIPPEVPNQLTLNVWDFGITQDMTAPWDLTPGPVQPHKPPHEPDHETSPKGNPRNNAATGASAAGARALGAQFVAFYFRAPIKAFFRTRVEYVSRSDLLGNSFADNLPQLYGITAV